MATKTFTVTSGGGNTSTISVNRDIEAGVRTFESGYVYPPSIITSTSGSSTHWSATETDGSWQLVSTLGNDSTTHFGSLNLVPSSAIRVGKHRIEFEITVNSGTINNGSSNIGSRPLVLGVRDYDDDPSTPAHTQIREVFEGSNTYDVEVFDDGIKDSGNFDPLIFLSARPDSIFDITVSNIKVTHNYNATTLDRTASVIDSDRKGESRPLLRKVVGAASAAYSLRDLNDKQGNNKVITVRRSGDDATREFYAKEVSNNTLRDWVREPLQLGARTARLGQSNTNESGFSMTWASDYRRVLVNKSAVTSGNKKVRIYDQRTDLDNSISSFPAKLKVEFNVSQLAGNDINTRTYTNRVNPITNFGIYLSVKDDDVDVDSPAYENKRFFQIKRGFNSFEFELFDDVDGIKPSIDILLNGYAFGLELVISGISITNLTEADGFVTKWHDQSGHGNHATQGNPETQPTIVEDGTLVKRNGCPAIKSFERVSGSRNALNITLDSLSADGKQSLFAVIENDVTENSNNAYGAVIQVYSTTSNSAHGGNGANRRPYWFIAPTGGVLHFSVNAYSGDTSVDRDKTLHTHIMTGSSGDGEGISTIHSDGEQVDTRSITLDDNSTFQSGQIARVAAGSTGALYISELIYYPSDQTANRPAIEANMANQHGITLS